MRKTGGSHTGCYPFLLDTCCVIGLAGTFRGLGFRKCGEKLRISEHTALLHPCDGFVAKKVGLVGGAQFFTALPKTAVSQYEKRPP